jgi:hypothetical protein
MLIIIIIIIIIKIDSNMFPSLWTIIREYIHQVIVYKDNI